MSLMKRLYRGLGRQNIVGEASKKKKMPWKNYRRQSVWNTRKYKV